MCSIVCLRWGKVFHVLPDVWTAQHNISYCRRLETASYQNEHNYGQDVKDGVAEQRPPAQRDRLAREFTHRTGEAAVMTDSGEARTSWSWCVRTCPAKMPQRPMMTRTLKTADPTIVPTPTSPLVINTPKKNRASREGKEIQGNISLI